MSYLRLFLLTVAVTAGVVSGWFYLHRSKTKRPEVVRVGEDLFLTSQLQPEHLRRLPYGIRTIVDLRPDGEEPGQSTSTEIGTAAEEYRLAFHYIPVPHESIPETAVQALAEVLSTESKPVVLYCRTGRRAARTLALAEASQTNGPLADAICQMVANAGFSAEDLRKEITERIAKRPHPEAQTP